MGYGDNVNRVIKKFVKAFLVLHGVFNLNKGHIIFATPKINAKEQVDIESCIARIKNVLTGINPDWKDFEFQIIANSNFATEIYQAVKNNIKDSADMSEVLVRAIKLHELCEKQLKIKK